MKRMELAGLAMALSLLATGVASAASVELSPRLRAAGGADVAVSIYVDPADGVQTMDFTFDYDPAALSPTAAYLADITAGFALTFDTSTPGTVVLTLSAPAPLASTLRERVAWVAFDAVGPDGTDTDLTWISAVLNGGGIASTTSDGRVTIQDSVEFCLGGTNAGDPCLDELDCPGCYGGTNNQGSCVTDADCPGTGTSCGGSCQPSRVMSAPDDAQGPPGAMLSVPVNVTELLGAESFDVFVEYNPDVAVPLSVEKTPLTSSMTLSYYLGISGQVRISMFGFGPLPAGSGAIVQIPFNLVGNPGDRTPLPLARAWINEQQIVVSFDDGLLTLCDPADADMDGVTGCGGDCDNADPDNFPGNAELCDGRDNNCDGVADDGFPDLGSACSAGIGACETAGSYVCSMDGLSTFCDAVPGDPVEESCDGLDNDCDGATDESIDPVPTACGDGVCASTGTLECIGGVPTDSCTAGMPTGTDENCDNLDDDCDGQTDEGFDAATTTCGTGACERTGMLACNAGIVTDSCAPGPPTGGDQDCDGIDDDCDGLTDEDYTPFSTTCGVGECQAAGIIQCIDGHPKVTCHAGTPEPEVCDALDNDCDGATDEDFDLDGDGVADCFDCDPTDPTNPDPPAEVGNSIIAARNGTTIELDWSPGTEYGTFRLYRGSRATLAPWVYNHECLGGPLVDSAYDDADIPPSNVFYYYLISREACGESGLGTDGSGAERPNDSPCPPGQAP